MRTAFRLRTGVLRSRAVLRVLGAGVWTPVPPPLVLLYHRYRPDTSCRRDEGRTQQASLPVLLGQASRLCREALGRCVLLRRRGST